MIVRNTKKLPFYEKFTENGFCLHISQTQINKSTINANLLVREVFKNSNLIDYSLIKPGEKRMIPCRVYLKNQILLTKVSFFIPKRRSSTSPEPRFWPYKLGKYVEAGTRLFFIVRIQDNSPFLEIYNHEPSLL